MIFNQQNSNAGDVNNNIGWRPYCVQVGSIKASHLRVFDEVRAYAHRLRAADSCHTVCAELAHVFFIDLEHVRGKFNYWDHSWLRFRDDPGVVIDAYPWACASGPILLYTGTGTPWSTLYRPDHGDGTEQSAPRTGL